ncbi:molybdenum cofactor cytidylyltransferase [Paramixta manurensis]|uniref:Molybdenum cofactor cytidylyltransferase n=1 Tax=Paramixta manurensis TaxID=2740817 RepID=A0A6M8UJ48_9GAMM|nr:molybdenum cofactor cytidylyltransferase [Erwiniaceae bacterium PD-1]
MEIGIILLAAGTSSRYRAACGRHKLLEPLNGEPLFSHTLRHAVAAGGPVTVLLRPEDKALQQLAQGTPQLLIESRGMGETLAAGVRAQAARDGWVVVPGDMPWLRPDSIRAVIAALAEHSIVRAYYRQQAGHPVGFRREHGAALMALHGDEGGRSLLRRVPLCQLALDDPGCVRDVDLPDMLGEG